MDPVKMEKLSRENIKDSSVSGVRDAPQITAVSSREVTPSEML